MCGRAYSLVMAVDQTRRVVRDYLEGHATDVIAEDAAFTMMGSGEVFRGREAIASMLNHFYHGIFEGRFEEGRLLVGDDWAVLEGEVVGELLEPVGGLAPNEGQVRVPLCVVYEVTGEYVAAARVYLDTSRGHGR